MPIDEIIGRRITGIRPFNELPIDEAIWKEAHNQHHLHRQLHAASAHRPGVVYGLEVIAAPSDKQSIIVAPGVAIDANGQAIVVPQSVTFKLEEPRRIFVVLSFRRDLDSRYSVTVGSGVQHYREVEGYTLAPVRELPKTAFVELARIFRSGPDAEVKDAAVPSAPANDELDLLYRQTGFPHCYADCGVGELAYVPKTPPWNPNRAGLWHLIQEANGRGFHLQFTGPLPLKTQGEGGPEPALLYVAGKGAFQALADAEIEGLRRFLENGGVLFGEAVGGNAEFAKAFKELAEKVGAKLKAVPKDHSVLTAHHVFSAPPPGARSDGSLQADDNGTVFLSDYDYGSAWQGNLEKVDAAAARERIRQAQEFGLNLIAYAARRRRTRDLLRMI